MKSLFPLAMVSAAALLAASALAQTATKPPAKPGSAVKTAAASSQSTAAKSKTQPQPHPTIIPRRPVFVPPPPVIELDEIAVVPGLPMVLDAETVDRYRRIFQAQMSGQFAQADGEIAQLKDKTLMGYVGAQRLLGTGYSANYAELA